jgi:hypothetical protein
MWVLGNSWGGGECLLAKILMSRDNPTASGLYPGLVQDFVQGLDAGLDFGWTRLDARPGLF